MTQRELHAAEFLCRNPRHENFSKLTDDQRWALARDILKVLVEKKHRAHFVCVNKKSLPDRDPWLFCFKLLVEHAEKDCKTSKSKKAMIILDKKPEHEENVLGFLTERRFKGKKPTT